MPGFVSANAGGDFKVLAPGTSPPVCNQAADTMRRLNERVLELEEALSVATSALARERIESADMRRHLQTLQTELQRFEEAV